MPVFADSQRVLWIATASLCLLHVECSLLVGPCSKSCGGGVRVYNRLGDVTIHHCNNEPCPANVLRDWGAWSRCSNHNRRGTSGVRYRYRDCPHASTDAAYLHCPGEQVQFKQCNVPFEPGFNHFNSLVDDGNGIRRTAVPNDNPTPLPTPKAASFASLRNELLGLEYIRTPHQPNRPDHNNAHWWVSSDDNLSDQSFEEHTSSRESRVAPPRDYSSNVDIDCVLDCHRDTDCKRIKAKCSAVRHVFANSHNLNNFLQAYMDDKLESSNHRIARRSVAESTHSSHNYFTLAVFICVAFIVAVAIGVALGWFFLAWRRHGYAPFRFRRKLMADSPILLDDGRVIGMTVTQL